MRGKTKRIICLGSLALLLCFVLLITIAYIEYDNLKKVFLWEISSAATSFLGQQASVKDLSFGPHGEIRFHRIAVQNPQGFPEGNLLTIDELSLKIRYKELLGRNLSFEKIHVQAPELFLMQNSEGLLNVSDKLRGFFQRRPTLRYQIDEFTLQSGIVDFNRDQKFRNDGLYLVMRNLSSEPGAKTTFRAHANYLESRIGINGWAYLKNEPTRLNLSISTHNVSLSPLKDSLRKYGGVNEKTTAALELHAEGDTAQGVKVSFGLRLTDAKFAFLGKDPKDIAVRVRAFWRIPDKTVRIDSASLDAAGMTAVRLNGDVKKFEENIIYSAWMKIDKLDLSAIDFGKNAAISGIVDSDNLYLQGDLHKAIPEISGFIRLRDARILTRDVDIAKMNADVTVHAVKEGAVDLTLKDLRYGGHTIPWLRAHSGIQFRDGVIAFESPTVETNDFRISSDHADIMLPLVDKRRVLRLQISGLDASYPEQQAGISNGVFSLALDAQGNQNAGAFDFSAKEIMYKNARTGIVEGTAHFDTTKFSIDIPRGDISGGKVRFRAEGRTLRDIFPMKVTLHGDNLDLKHLSEDIAHMTGISYSLSGLLNKADFAGTVDSAQSVRGRATIQAGKITVPDEDKKRTIIREGTARAEIDFAGEDLAFRADAATGTFAAIMEGTLRDFAQKKRSAELKISIPEIELSDIRETFWDIFPDSLLYAGMEGSLASDLLVQTNGVSTVVEGNAALKDIVLTGENGEYTVGPVNGIIPLAYSKGKNPDGASPPQLGKDESESRQDRLALPSFEQEAFQSLSQYYAQRNLDDSYRLLTVGAIRIGFPLLDAINIRMKAEGNYLHIGQFSGNIFGGKLNGSAIIDLADAFQYRAGFLVEGLSLTELCNRIEPIRGYISGKVDGIGAAKGDGGGLSRLLGKADFWTYSTETEETKISKEFLQKVGGASLQRYLGDRKFDRGIMNLYLQNGYLIFRELEISNRNFFGMKDLDIKVAPLNNRISIDHLLWSITEAAYRAKEKE